MQVQEARLADRKGTYLDHESKGPPTVKRAEPIGTASTYLEDVSRSHWVNSVMHASSFYG